MLGETPIRVALVVLALNVFTSTLWADRHPNKNSEILMKHGYSITLEGMVAALKDSDGEVRDRAASELANQKMTAAIPDIRAALGEERDPDIQVNLAYSLAQLGDKEGFTALKHSCDTAAASPRLKAALYMLRFNDESCFSAVKSVLESRSEGDHEFVVNAMSLVPSFRRVSSQDKRELIMLTARELNDPTPLVRVTASQILEKVGDAEVIPSLEKAILDEKDPVVRSSMQVELDKLKERAKPTTSNGPDRNSSGAWRTS